MSLTADIEAAPKAELHLHLEGAIRPATLLELARRNGVTLPAGTVDGLREWFRFRDFPHFIEVYLAVTRCLKTADDYELIVYEVGEELAGQNCRYAEVTFTPLTHYLLGIPQEVYFDGLRRGRRRVREELGVELSWVFDIARETSSKPDFAQTADYTLGVALEGVSEGVVALGLGGFETKYPPEPFAPWFDRARAAGLHSMPHAGETAGPASIWGAIRALGAERLGHGVRAIEDPALVEYLAAHRIPIDVCPTSNLRLGVYPDYESHPLRRLYDAGVPVTINTDDPALFNTTLNHEAALLAGPFGFSREQVGEILLNGVRFSFLPEERKAALLRDFRASDAAL